MMRSTQYLKVGLSLRSHPNNHFWTSCQKLIKKSRQQDLRFLTWLGIISNTGMLTKCFLFQHNHVFINFSLSLYYSERESSSSTIREDKGVGHSHHRKTRSRCSIDWTLPPTDLLIENHQQLENLQRHQSNVCDNVKRTSKTLQGSTNNEEFWFLVHQFYSKLSRKV